MCSAHACAFFSATGVLFMTWVGVLLVRQPFFVTGIPDLEVAKGSAFGAAGTFVFTFLVSMLYVLRDGRRGLATAGLAGRSSGGSGGLDEDDDDDNVAPWLRHGGGLPFLRRREELADRTALFHDYDPVDSTVASSAEEVDSPGVFT